MELCVAVSSANRPTSQLMFKTVLPHHNQSVLNCSRVYNNSCSFYKKISPWYDLVHNKINFLSFLVIHRINHCHSTILLYVIEVLFRFCRKGIIFLCHFQNPENLHEKPCLILSFLLNVNFFICTA